MKLLTEEIRRRLPALYATQNDHDPIIQVKFFTPWTNWTWYVTEFDGEDFLFGLVEGFETEWGYSSLAELESIRGPGGLRIERDLYFEPTRVIAVPSLRKFVRAAQSSTETTNRTEDRSDLDSDQEMRPADRRLTESEALDRIREALDGVEWNADTFNFVVDLVRRAGRLIRDLDNN